MNLMYIPTSKIPYREFVILMAIDGEFSICDDI